MYLVQVIVKKEPEYNADSEFVVESSFIYDGPEEDLRKLCDQFGEEDFEEKAYSESQTFIGEPFELVKFCHRHIVYTEVKGTEIRKTIPEELLRENRKDWKCICSYRTKVFVKDGE